MVGIFRSEVRQSHEGNHTHGRPWERSGSVDIEELLVWAYAVQMVDRFERVGLHAIEADAMGFEPRGYSADGCGQLMAIDHLGCRIDGGGRVISDCVHPVAYAVAAAVGSMGTDGPLLRRYASASTRPTTWRAPEHKARPRVWVKEGEKGQVEYVGPGRKGAHVPIIIVWDEKRQAWGRDEYTRWHAALGEVAWRLSTKALGFTISGPIAPAKPWVEGELRKQAKPSSVFLDKGKGGTPPAGPPKGAS